MTKKLGSQSAALASPVVIAAFASVVGGKEGQGPLKDCFDFISEDSYFGQKTWEKAESEMARQCFTTVLQKANISPAQLDCIFAGDLLNQCMASTTALKDSGVPYIGVYGACSTMAETLMLAATAIDGGFAETACALTCSHFCTSERQYRFPLEYGGVRAPTTQWTVTGAGSLILKASGAGPQITTLTTGKIVDAGITDANNMGAAMAPAAYETLKAHFADTGRTPEYYDLILTGDLGRLGHDIVEDFFIKDGAPLGARYQDCGVLIYDFNSQDVHSGGSGCGCCASVLCSDILRRMQAGELNRVLFAATGALLSTTTNQQGDSIPGVCHALSIENPSGK